MITVIVVKVERYGFTLPECIQKGGDGIANSVDPDQTAPRSSLFWVCTVCSDLSVPILRTFTVMLNKGRIIMPVFYYKANTLLIYENNTIQVLLMIKFLK